MEKKMHPSNELKDSASYYYNMDISDKVDVKGLIAKVWFKRKFIYICTGVFLMAGLFVAIVSPVSYKANCTVVPQVSNSRGNLGGLASMMGVNIGSSSSGETLSPNVYPQIINSVPFCKEIMETPIVVERSNGVPITLYDYYINNEYQPTNVISNIKRYTIGLPGLIFSAIRSSDREEETVHTDTNTGDVVKLSSKERMVFYNIKDNIQFYSNPKEGYIRLGYSFSEPQPTADIAQNIYITLEKYVKNYKSQKQQDNLDFVEESYENARNDFMEKQAALAAFQDANRDLTSAMARTTELRLNSEYQVAYTVYNDLAVQLEQAKISVNESTPVLTVIDPVVVPFYKSAPRRGLIIISFLFLGLLVSLTWVFLKPFLKDLFSHVENQKTNNNFFSKKEI